MSKTINIYTVICASRPRRETTDAPTARPPAPNATPARSTMSAERCPRPRPARGARNATTGTPARTTMPTCESLPSKRPSTISRGLEAVVKRSWRMPRSRSPASEPARSAGACTAVIVKRARTAPYREKPSSNPGVKVASYFADSHQAQVTRKSASASRVPTKARNNNSHPRASPRRHSMPARLPNTTLARFKLLFRTADWAPIARVGVSASGMRHAQRAGSNSTTSSPDRHTPRLPRRS